MIKGDVEVIKRPPYEIKAAISSSEFYSNYDDAPAGSVAIISISGVMVREDTWCDYGTQTIANQIRAAADHPNISSIILIANSGGGSVNSIWPLVDSILYALELKPIIGFIDDMCASAAYYVLSYLPLIIASNNISAWIGSIGVFWQLVNMQPYYEAMGFKFHNIYAPESTHKNLPVREAFDNNNEELIKNEVLSPLAIKFQEAVRQNRAGKLDESVEGLLNGKMFYAEDALKAGLIDQIGNFDTALQMAAQLSAKQVINNFNFN
jgi:protease-4